MPYKASSKKYKRRYKRRSAARPSEFSRWGAWARKGTNIYEMANAAYSGLWKLKGLVNSEMYKFDSTMTAQSLNQASPTVQPLHGIAQGDGDNQRSGNSIYARAWNFKALLYRSTSGDQAQMVRISVVQDNQQGADTTPSYTDVYETTDPFSHLNSNTVGRFKVLYSKTLTLDVVKSLSQAIDINIPMRHHIRYNGVNGTDIQKGGLYLLMTSSQGTANFPLISGEYRLSYHDN